MHNVRGQIVGVCRAEIRLRSNGSRYLRKIMGFHHQNNVFISLKRRDNYFAVFTSFFFKKLLTNVSEKIL